MNTGNFFSICSEMIDVYTDISASIAKPKEKNKPEWRRDSKSSITLNYGGDKVHLMLYQIHKYFALVFIIKEYNNDRPYIIDHNI